MCDDLLPLSRREFLGASAGLVLAMNSSPRADEPEPASARKRFEPVAIPDSVYSVTTMGYGSVHDVKEMADADVQVLHTGGAWPYFPLIRDGGSLPPQEDEQLREVVETCHRHGIKLSLGLPPFPPVELVRKHPDWRIHDEPTRRIMQVEPKQGDLSTRIGCNVGPWGDYLIEVCGELVEHYKVDGFSFDGNYHPPICYCPACHAAYRADAGKELPAPDLNSVEYRRYLVWRGERLEEHYRRMQQRIKGVDPDAALMSWTVNAGRYGHLLHSPRAMPTRMNLLFDLPIQEWWLDETNLGASVAPAFGAAYLHATTGGRPCASEPYLMSRGNPYGTHSFPAHERLTRSLLAVTHGNVTAQSFGWPGHRESARETCGEVNRRAEWLVRAEPLPWAAMLVSEQTRQFYAYRNIAELFLPHVFGAFRCALEEHLPLRLINDWDVTADELAKYQVLVLPNAAALSDEQMAAVREFVRGGGGLVATGETSLCDELGQPRGDFALSDVFGVSFRGRPRAVVKRTELDANFALHLDESYWNERVGLAALSWEDHEFAQDERLTELVPGRSVIFRGPQVLVSEPEDRLAVAIRLRSDGSEASPSPAAVVRSFGQGKVVYLAAALDAALWSYSFPYQRVLLSRAIGWAAAVAPAVRVQAPMCVQAAFYRQTVGDGRRLVVHLFNDINTSGQHGLPSAEVPLREESVPIGGIRASFRAERPKSVRWEPEGVDLPLRSGEGDIPFVEVPPLGIHGLVVAEL